MEIHNYTQEAIEEIIKATVTETLAATGQGSGLISQVQAKKLYGRWFIKAMEAGRIRPVVHGEGATSTRWYSVVEIRSLLASERLVADFQSKTLTQSHK